MVQDLHKFRAGAVPPRRGAAHPLDPLRGALRLPRTLPCCTAKAWPSQHIRCIAVTSKPDEGELSWEARKRGARHLLTPVAWNCAAAGHLDAGLHPGGFFGESPDRCQDSARGGRAHRGRQHLRHPVLPGLLRPPRQGTHPPSISPSCRKPARVGGHHRWWLGTRRRLLSCSPSITARPPVKGDPDDAVLPQLTCQDRARCDGPLKGCCCGCRRGTTGCGGSCPTCRTRRLRTRRIWSSSTASCARRTRPSWATSSTACASLQDRPSSTSSPLCRPSTTTRATPMSLSSAFLPSLSLLPSLLRPLFCCHKKLLLLSACTLTRSSLQPRAVPLWVSV